MTSHPPDNAVPQVVTESLAAAIEALGTAPFYDHLLAMLRTVLGDRPSQIIHYSRHVAPRYIASHRTRDVDRDAYVSTYYPYDPMYRRLFDDDLSGFVHLASLLTEGQEGDYMTLFFPETGMTDDIGMTFPTLDDGLIGVFAQSEHHFAPAEVHQFQTLRPLLRALLAAQNRAALLALQAGQADAAGNPYIAVVDRAGRIVFETAAMAQLSRSEPNLGQALADLVRETNRSSRRLILGTLTVVSPSNSIATAPDHRLCYYEAGTKAVPPASLQERITGFIDSLSLTRQQAEVLMLVLRGYPSALIATRLGLSEGTVRNYRKSIHDRLDVTTEREIFRLFLDHLIADQGAEVQSA